MTREHAAALLEAFREQGDDVSPVDPYVLAQCLSACAGLVAPCRRLIPLDLLADVQILGIELGGLPEAPNIIDHHPVAIRGDQPVLPKLHKHPVHVHIA